MTEQTPGATPSDAAPLLSRFNDKYVKAVLGYRDRLDRTAAWWRKLGRLARSVMEAFAALPIIFIIGVLVAVADGSGNLIVILGPAFGVAIATAKDILDGGRQVRLGKRIENRDKMLVLLKDHPQYAAIDAVQARQKNSWAEREAMGTVFDSFGWRVTLYTAVLLTIGVVQVRTGGGWVYFTLASLVGSIVVGVVLYVTLLVTDVRRAP